jgi:hypothetical protein
MKLLSYNPEVSNQPLSNPLTVVINHEPKERKPFIEANTIEGSITDIRSNHIIPVFTKDNEPLISQLDFIETTQDVVAEVFRPERILSPSIRLSHPVKGRVPEARNKPASELYEWERTIYYERMAFIIEVPSISDTIDEERISLTIGGVKAYNLDNLGGKKGVDEHFKIFIGFSVKVCTNLCVYSDGFVGDVKARNLEQLRLAIYQLIRSFDAISQLTKMESLQNYSLTEHQFAQLVGRCRMYQHLPLRMKEGLPEMQFGDAQINSVIRDYYKDHSFCRETNGDINLWRLYNLFTTANKQSYIDTFLDRGSNASAFLTGIQAALDSGSSHWFIN